MNLCLLNIPSEEKKKKMTGCWRIPRGSNAEEEEVRFMQYNLIHIFVLHTPWLITSAKEDAVTPSHSLSRSTSMKSAHHIHCRSERGNFLVQRSTASQPRSQPSIHHRKWYNYIAGVSHNSRFFFFFCLSQERRRRNCMIHDRGW